MSQSFMILIFLSFFSCFHARPLLEDPLTALTSTNHNITWHGFVKFLDVEKGSHVTGMSELKKYFQRFGYLAIPDVTNLTDSFDKQLESAVIQYQKNLGLPVTGKIDTETLTQIMSPRCGMSDTAPKLHATKRYDYFYGKPKWGGEKPMILTYGISPDDMVDYLNLWDVKAVFRRAFARWAAVIPVSFEEIDEFDSADIHIGFYRGDHGDGQPFDGVLGVLAHSFSPENGRLHMDAGERWAVDIKGEKSKVAVDLESVATHEIGHVLGLAHSSVKEAVMYPSLSPRTKKVELKIDDVEGVQALYGSNPNFKYSSLLETIDQSSSSSIHGSTKLTNTCLWILIVFILLIFMYMN